MKKHIKTVAGVLALVIVFSGGAVIERENISFTAPITASADTYGAFNYAIEYGEITITGFDKSVRDVVIPSEIEGIPVTTIGDSAFSGCDGITSITIPNSVTSIGKQAFRECSRIASITIPDSVATIGKETFQYCSGLTSIVIPDSVTTIGDSAFYHCDGITSIVISSSVKTIGEEAFYHCSGITSITIPESVTSIGYYSFADCINLKSITFMNPDCIIDGRAISAVSHTATLDDSKMYNNFIIYGYENSTAQEYAEKYSNTFYLIGTTPETSTTNDKKGDVNEDDDVNISDAVLIMQSIANPDEFKISEQGKLNGDVVDNGNGLTNIDALAIQYVEIKTFTSSIFPMLSSELEKYQN